MKKLLLIGPAFFNYNDSVVTAFERRGFIVKKLEYNEKFGMYRTSNKVDFFLSRNKEMKAVSLLKKFNKELIDIYNEFKPDVFFSFKGNVIEKSVLLQMKSSVKIMWMMDSLYYYPNLLNVVDSFDFVFSYERNDIKRLKEVNRNSYYLPMGYDESTYFPIEIENKSIDIAFIGALHPIRKKLIDDLISEFPDLKIKVYGKHISLLKNPLKYLNNLLDNRFINRNVSPVVANKIYNTSKICLNIHENNSFYGVNPRFFEIIGSDSIQVVDNMDFIVDFFSKDNVYVYGNSSDLFNIIRKILLNVDHVKNDALYEKVHENHKFHNRIEEICEICSLLKK